MRMVARPLYEIKIHKPTVYVGFIIVLLQIFPWIWKTSGTLQYTELWQDYAWGYKYILNSFGWGDMSWPLNRENLYYIKQMFAFMGVPDVTVEIASGFEMHRSLYALFCNCLWFLGPLASGIIVNVIIWFICCLSGAYVAATFSEDKPWQWLMVIMVATGQGFIFAVGEISPHVYGYAAMWPIVALTCYLRLWDYSARFFDNVIVYGIIGLLQLGYNTPLLSLPIVICASLYAEWHRPVNSWSQRINYLARITLQILIALLPFAIMLTATAKYAQAQGVLGYTLKAIQQVGLSQFFINYLFASFEGFSSYGPVIIVLFIVGVLIALLKQEKIIITSSLIAITLFLLIGFFTTTIDGKGYVTYAISTLVIFVATYCLYTMWISNKVWMKTACCVVMGANILYNHLPLLGYSQSTYILAKGLIRTLTDPSLQHYEKRYFE